MSRWEREERSRLSVLAAFDEAEADVGDGRFAHYTNDTLSTLATEIKRKARVRGKRR